jgi:SAM-dependent methyltransferase
MNASQPNAQYSLLKPQSFSMRIVEHARRRMFDAFLSATEIAPSETLLDVGVTSDTSYRSSNYLEAWYPYKDKITAVGIDEAGFLRDLYPGVKVVCADGRRLPFPDATFDVVHSSAVWEHVGATASQGAFIAELARVARRAVFLTTPDRAFPVEVHTSLPLLHWLPKASHRAALRALGFGFFANEGNLNLLWGHEAARLARAVTKGQVHVSALRTFGWPSNILCSIRFDASRINGQVSVRA